MDPCVLAQTGVGQIYLMLLGGAAVLIAFILFSKQRGLQWRGVFSLVFAVMMIGSVVMPIRSLFAQSVDNCSAPAAVSGQNGGEHTDGAVLVLHNDVRTMLFPTESETVSFAYFSLLENDIAPEGDAINWSTVDIDPITPDVQQYIAFQHPDAPTDKECTIASVQHGGFGVLEVYMNYQCSYWDEDLEDSVTFIIPDDYQIPLFSYTATTQSGLPATAPAMVTISTAQSVPEGVVVANEDFLSLCYGATEESIDILENDTTSVGSLVPATIDLDLSLPGIQQQVSYEDQFGSMSASVDNDGILHVAVTGGTFPIPLYYTVQNTNGTVSNITKVYKSINACMET